MTLPAVLGRYQGLATFNRRRGRHGPENEHVSEIIIHDDETVDRALRRFKRLCERSGILADLRKRRHYEKPSERRKRKASVASRKTRRLRPA